MDNGLEKIAVSKSMMTVAQYHADAMAIDNGVCGYCENFCGLHSWPDPINQQPRWNRCCYRADNSDCMWSKPIEITKDWPKPYFADGFENAVRLHGPPIEGMESRILRMWTTSNGHNAVILNEKEWHDVHWKAIGAGISFNSQSNRVWAYLWFGMEKDNNTYPDNATFTTIPINQTIPNVSSQLPKETTVVINPKVPDFTNDDPNGIFTPVQTTTGDTTDDATDDTTDDTTDTTDTTDSTNDTTDDTTDEPTTDDKRINTTKPVFGSFSTNSQSAPLRLIQPAGPAPAHYPFVLLPDTNDKNDKSMWIGIVGGIVVFLCISICVAIVTVLRYNKKGREKEKRGIKSNQSDPIIPSEEEFTNSKSVSFGSSQILPSTPTNVTPSSSHTEQSLQRTPNSESNGLGSPKLSVRVLSDVTIVELVPPPQTPPGYPSARTANNQALQI